MTNKQVIFAQQIALPAIGQGTWYMGENASRRRDEVNALRAGLDLGLQLIDTAEMYADGAAEEIVGEALTGRREHAFLVSKVYPWNAGGQKMIAACEGSLRRLNTDYLDLYLLHWMGDYSFEETVSAMETLIAQGKIRRWGVSNLDYDDMQALWQVTGGNSVPLIRCCIMWHRGVLSMIYSPGVSNSRCRSWPTARWPRQGVYAVMCSRTPWLTISRELAMSAPLRFCWRGLFVIRG